MSGDGRVWQFGCGDAESARAWVTMLRAFAVGRDSVIARQLPRTRPGGAGADDALVRALLVTKD